MFDWLEKKILKIVAHQLDQKLDQKLKDKEGTLIQLNANAQSLRAHLETIKNDISALETIRLRVPIEDYIMRSTIFQNAMNEGRMYASADFAPLTLKYGLKEVLPSIKGEVTLKKPFSIITGENDTTVLVGLKTRYKGQDQGLFEMQIADRRSKPFVIDQKDQQILFLKAFIIRPEYLFELKQLEGKGQLSFSLLGATITKWKGL